MRASPLRSVFVALVLSTALVLGGCEVPAGSAAAGTLPDLQRATPEEVGMSSERLARLHDAMQQLVDEGRLAGITTMIARRGRIVDFQTFGYRDLEEQDPMAEDDIFRIYSMSKPITGVALMTLYEEGAFQLSDAVEEYIPELSDLQVVRSWGPNGPVLEEADHPMTIRELMSHTAGLAYGIGAPGPVDSMYAARGVLARDQTLEDMIDKLAGMPLRHQPGTQWFYSIAVDVQGYLVEVLSGQPFDEFLEERLFGPLGMVDTGFHVPEEDHDRFAEYYRYDDAGGLVAQPATGAPGSRPYLDPTTFFSGGGGLVSTTMDYMRFSQMLLNGGELDGVRILSPTTVALMSRNQMPREAAERAPGVGFGLDFNVVLDPIGKEYVSVGEFSWGGAAGTWFWIDPVEELVFVGMIQQAGSPRRPNMGQIARQLTYQAITELQAEVE
ncbi:MAG TPA: serine hydrolase domain-containing protein [Longimicrobiales bacterium]|nr:serine hydrolase domain-containing protein [Longimicrobiales bacterium]